MGDRQYTGDISLTVNGVTRTLDEWADLKPALRLDAKLIRRRLKGGWDPEDAVTRAREERKAALPEDKAAKYVKKPEQETLKAPKKRKKIRRTVVKRYNSHSVMYVDEWV